MHDIRLIRDNPEAFDAGLARRGLSPMASDLLALDEKRRAVITELQAGQTRRNEASKAIGAAKAAKDEATASRLMAEVATLKTRLPELEDEERSAETALNEALAAIPNLPLDDVPAGADEDDNQLIHERGTKPVFAFDIREHDAIGPALGLDFETGVALAGARFTLVRGAAARLNRALGQFGLDILTKHHGYEEVVPPLMVRDEVMFGTGQLPKFEDDLFVTDIALDPFEYYEFKRKAYDEWLAKQSIDPKGAISLLEKDVWHSLPNPNTRRWLIPTSEVSLTNIVREKILAADELPLRFTALTPCFRSEAGAAGRDTRGFIRQHQFEKAEMVSIVPPDQSEAEHERMTAAAEDVLTRLGLPFRRMKLCTGDMGFSAARTYDLEVWLPGQGRYREISSCSTCTDFQARRMNARFRGEDGKPAFVHTLNGSGLVVGRMMVAILENYQQEDGAVAIPDALQPYLGGLNRLEPKA
nr:serine--tRNA ligase [Sphingomonas asaccharolytica]